MKPDHVYRHDRTLDIDIYVHNVHSMCKEYTDVTVSYLNRHMRIFQGDPERILITSEQMPFWKDVSQDREIRFSECVADK